MSRMNVVEIRPELVEQGKTTTVLARTDILLAFVQVVASGGENQLHAHTGQDALWVVLNGEAVFYDEQDRALRVGRHQAVLIPRGTPYWFESAGPEPLVILRVAAIAQDVADERVGAPIPQFDTKVRSGAFFGRE